MLIAKSKNGWELHTISNGRLSCENYNIESATDIDRVRSTIQLKFGNVIQEEGIIVSWDNWSGTFITQMPGMNTASSDVVIREIYDLLANCNNVE